MNYQQLPQMYQSFENNMEKKQVDYVIVKINGSPNKDKLGLDSQVKIAIEPHLYASLNKNYRIDSIGQNDPSESYILFHKK